MIVSVTPGNVGFGVEISSVNANGYEFGTVNLGATTASTAAIVVKSSGSAAEFFAIKVYDSGSNAWTALNADGTPGHDQLELLGRFQADQPLDGDFSVTDDLVTGVSPGTAG